MNQYFGTTSSFNGDVLGISPLSHFSGVSPTTYACGTMLFRAMAASAKSSQSSKTDYLPKPVNSKPNPYTEYHQLAFMDCTEGSSLVENAAIEDLNAVDHKGNTPLLWAVSEGRMDMARLLVDSGANVNVQNYEGISALYLGAERGDLDLCLFLIENGASVNIQTEEGVAPAHIAATNGHLEILRALAGHGAHLEITDSVEETPLHYAVRGGQEEVVRFLVMECKANLNCLNEDLETPLQLASCFDETRLVEFLTAAAQQKEHEGTWNALLEQVYHGLKALETC